MNLFNRARIPEDWESTVTIRTGEEVPAHKVGGDDDELAKVWDRLVELHRCGIHPAVQICVRRHGEIVMHRSIGYARGVGPREPADAHKVIVTPDTPFNIFSASKAVTAILMHILDERNALHVDDYVADYIPEFANNGKQHITIKHLLNHRAGIAATPPEAMHLDCLADQSALLQILCEMKPSSRAGGRLAYHALSSGFILAEIIRRVTGRDIRELQRREIVEPLGLRWGNFGVAPRDVDKVAVNYFTGAPILPPFTKVVERLLGVGLEEGVELSNDPRFLTAIVPSANVVMTADELSRYYQMLLDGGRANGAQILQPRTIRRATAEQAWMEPDLMLIVPIRYSQGFMLGADYVSVFGPDTDKVYGHIGLTNVVGWADPERQIAAAIMTNGKPLIYPELWTFYTIPWQLATAFPKTEPRPRRSPRRAEPAARRPQARGKSGGARKKTSPAKAPRRRA